jgi:hypothetical protein
MAIAISVDRAIGRVVSVTWRKRREDDLHFANCQAGGTSGVGDEMKEATRKRGIAAKLAFMFHPHFLKL